MPRAANETVHDERHERSDQPADQSQTSTSYKLLDVSDEEARQLGLPDWRTCRYYRMGPNGHLLRCRDKTAGVRMYRIGRKKKVWTGTYFVPAVCDFFWAPVAFHVFEADTQEHLGWPELYRKTARAIGDDPERPKRLTGVVADRAFTNNTFVEHNTAHGVASITPERKLAGNRPWSDLRDADGGWDEHGPRCRYCGGPAAPFVGPGEGFVLTAVDARLRYRCHIGWTEECRTKLQTVSCFKQPLALLPIGRQERVFHDLLAAHQSFEGVFDAWRDRYAVAGNSVASRSKRRYAVTAQKLRAAAALLAEWFRICLRQGYLAGHPTRNTAQPQPRLAGARALVKLRAYREEQGLILPIGPKAQNLGPPGANAPPA